MPTSDERFTPPSVIAIRDRIWRVTDTDPCWHPRSFSTATVTYTEKEDGTKQPWFGRVWMNPPWSDMLRWIGLLIAQCRAVPDAGLPDHEGMAMVRNDPSTRWWKLAWATADAVVFLSERTVYMQVVDGEVVPCGTPAFTSVIFYWGGDAESFLREFNSAGHYGVPLTKNEGRMNKKEKAKKAENVATVAEHLVMNAGTQFEEAYSLMKELLVLADEGEEPLMTDNELHDAFDAMTIGDLIAAGVAVAPPIVLPPRRNKPKNKAPASKKKVAKKPPKRVPAKKKAAKKKPTKNVPAKSVPAKKRSNEIQCSRDALDERERLGIRPRTTIDLWAWVRRSRLQVFTASDVMDEFLVSRQTALRTINKMEGLEKLGAGPNTRYQVAS